MPRPFDRKDFCIKALRRASYRCPMRTQAMVNARVSRGLYKCAECKSFAKVKEIALDHKLPVIPVTGWDNLDGFAERLLCPVEGWQVLCKECHRLKTNKENEERRRHKNENRLVSRKSHVSKRKHLRRRLICN